MIDNKIQNELRLKWKKSDAIQYVKEMCSKISVEDMSEFTSTAIKAAYDAKRIKALDYLLGLENRCDATLLVKIHVGYLLSNIKVSEKDIDIWKILCNHFTEKDLLESIENFKKYLSTQHKEKFFFREKEMIRFVFEKKLQNNPTTNKSFKI